MPMYCGIDLHSSNNLLVVLDQKLETLFERRLRNDLGQVLASLEPFREDLVGIAIEIATKPRRLPSK